MKSNKWPKSAGIYKLTCIENGKVYIGKSINLDQRLKSYRSYQRSLKYRGRLANAIRKYGWDSFTVEILKEFENFNVLDDNEELLLLESNYIIEYNSTDPKNGYNMCIYSNDFSGRTHTKESRENMSRGKLGSKHSDETKLKMSEARLGIKLSEKTKLKMSLSQRESNSKEETRLNRIKCRLGKKHSPDALEKMRKAKSIEVLGEDEYRRRVESKRKENLSPEVLEKMSKWQIGKKLSTEHKEKLRLAKLGKKQSEETKMKSRLTRARNKLLKNQESH
jgi:group I intron endonuclease